MKVLVFKDIVTRRQYIRHICIETFSEQIVKSITSKAFLSRYMINCYYVLRACSTNRGEQMIDINRIIEEKSIEVYFQAILSPNEATSINVESFIRGIDPISGVMIPPNYLFEVAAKHRLERTLDRLCIEETFSRFSNFHELNSHAMLYLNINPSFFNEAVDTNFLMQVCQTNGILTRRVVIDISNLFISKDDIENKSLLGQIKKLRAQGFYISLDDIGRNYFNLDRILYFNPDVIKINHQMFGSLDNNTYKNLMIKHVIDLAHQMGILVVSTGVESEEDVYDSLEAGAQLIQGYYVAAPSNCQYEDVVQIVEDFDRHFIFQQIDAQYEQSQRDAINNVLTFVNNLRERMSSYDFDDIDQIAKIILNKYPFIESGFLIDPSGKQTSPSYVNKDNFHHRNMELFGLYDSGTDHSDSELYSSLQHPLLTDWVTRPHRSRLSNRISITASFKLSGFNLDDYIVVMNIDYLEFERYSKSNPLTINLD